MERLGKILIDAGVLSGMNKLLTTQEKCFLVGGALRDFYLDRPISDFDFVTSKDPTELANKFAQKIGGKCFFLDEKRRYSRIVLKRKDATLTYDFTPFRGPDLLADLRLRDFTINAMALMVGESSKDLTIFDPLNGRKDLSQKILRACGANSFQDDPLRILKGVRHAITLGFGIDSQTRKWMIKGRPLIERVPPERIRNELAIVLNVCNACKIFDLLKSFDLIDVIFGPHMDEGSYEKGVACAAQVENFLQNWKSPVISERLEKLLEEEVGDGFHRAGLMRLASFIKGYAPESLDHFHLAVRLSNKNRSTMDNLINMDVEKGKELLSLSCTERGQAQWASSLGTDFLTNILFLSALDEKLACRKDKVSEVLRNTMLLSRNGLIPDLVDGRTVQEILKIPTGPQVGKVLLQLRREEIAGRVNSPEEAKKLLISLHKKMIDKESFGAI